MNTQTSLNFITRDLVPEDQRMAITERYFNIHFLQFESVVCGFTDRMAEDYHGGYWDMYTLSNGGFYMVPSGDHVYNVKCDNQFEGNLSSDGIGVAACLYAYSYLSFSDGRFGRVCAAHYYHLREYMLEHSEVSAILGATD